jgi:superfamily II DNA or RNA helicase
MIVQQINESYSLIDAEPRAIKDMFEYLKVERPGAYFDPLVKAGFKSAYEHFAAIDNKKLFVMNGHLGLLSQFGVQANVIESEFSEAQIDKTFSSIIEQMPFTPYDYQIKCAKECLLKPKQLALAATGSGKSCIIFLIIMFLLEHKKSGAIIVPNTNLLEQLKCDFVDYIVNPAGKQNLLNLIDVHGGGNKSSFDKPLVISTWQTLMNTREHLPKLEFIITDETHRYASDVTSSIVKESSNAKYKWGFTGTLPEDPVMKMMLFGLFGLPKRYIRSSELIERGLGTPIKIKTIVVDYNTQDKRLFKECKGYQKQLNFVKQHEKRQELLINLSTKLSGNTLILGQHTEHLKSIFIDIMAKLHPDVEVKNKDITGKKSFEFQENYGVYFINGEDDAATREKTRKIIEDHDNSITVANFAVMSTGANIKKLHNLVLGSPLKSYTTITQSIGRLMRLHPDKSEAVVYDIVDNFGMRGFSGIFYKQYQARKSTSYNPEGFPVQEVIYSL